VLLDSKTKLLLKSYPASELHGWRATDAGRRGHKHGLTLEFRGTSKSPWTVSAQSADAFRSVAVALWDMIGVGNQPSDSTVQRPFNADLLDFSTYSLSPSLSTHHRDVNKAKATPQSDYAHFCHEHRKILLLLNTE